MWLMWAKTKVWLRWFRRRVNLWRVIVALKREQRRFDAQHRS